MSPDASRTWAARSSSGGRSDAVAHACQVGTEARRGGQVHGWRHGVWRPGRRRDGLLRARGRRRRTRGRRDGALRPQHDGTRGSAVVHQRAQCLARIPGRSGAAWHDQQQRQEEHYHRRGREHVQLLPPEVVDPRVRGRALFGACLIDGARDLGDGAAALREDQVGRHQALAFLDVGAGALVEAPVLPEERRRPGGGGTGRVGARVSGEDRHRALEHRVGLGRARHPVVGPLSFRHVRLLRGPQPLEQQRRLAGLTFRDVLGALFGHDPCRQGRHEVAGRRDRRNRGHEHDDASGAMAHGRVSGEVSGRPPIRRGARFPSAGRTRRRRAGWP